MKLNLRTRTKIISAGAVLIFGFFIWAIFIPPGLGRWSKAAYESCNAKLKTIYVAQLMWCEDHGGDTNLIVTPADLAGSNGYFKKLPSCPEGGTYMFRKAGEYPRCSIPMHSLEFGRVLIVDVGGSAIPDARVTLTLPGKPSRTLTTDRNGETWLTDFPASEANAWDRGVVSVLRSNQSAQSIALPTNWPLRIAIK